MESTAGALIHGLARLERSSRAWHGWSAHPRRGTAGALIHGVARLERSSTAWHGWIERSSTACHGGALIHGLARLERSSTAWHGWSAHPRLGTAGALIHGSTRHPSILHWHIFHFKQNNIKLISCKFFCRILNTDYISSAYYYSTCN